MNYRHIYHAGNFADVFKHCILIMLMRSLLQKDKPITYLDTHAGIGRYDLGSENAKKTLEHEDGIGRLYKLQDFKSSPEVINAYLQIVRGINKDADLPRFYPGSPRIVRSLLRDQDSMILVEKHPEDVLELKLEFRRDSQVAVHCMDGYQGMKAFLPPKKGRGLILIDPAFEEKDEWQQIIAAMQIALNRFPIGIYAIWYPIKERSLVEDFYRDLKRLGVPNILIAELSVGEIGSSIDDDSESGLTSCGMAIINSPWQFDNQLKSMVAWLSSVLAVGPTAKSDMRYYSG